MKKYKSDCDAGTILCLAGYVLALGVPLILSCDWLSVIIWSVGIIFMVFTICGIWYEVDGNEMVVYTFFRPSRYPIDKISEIKSVRSCLSAPALSFDRLAIKFSDRKILKSYLPLYISPKHRGDFVKQLIARNPCIKLDL